MNIAKDIAKRGWHPEKDGKGLSSLLKRDKDSSSSTSSEAAGSARPLSSLKDPSSFGPPPKSVHHPNYDPAVDGPSSSPSKKPGPPLPKRDGAPEASVKKTSIEGEEPKPTGPYRVDTTGLKTTGLPPPPTRIISRADTAPITTSPSATRAPPPAPPTRASPPSVPIAQPAVAAASPPVAAKPKPALPPRLPPREEMSPPLLNQGATDRLASAGVSVPGLGIGQSKPAPPTVSKNPSLSGHMPGRDANVSELEAKFAKIRATEREQEGSGASAPTPRAATRQEEPPPVPLGTKPR